jgi:hypothetical protein
MKGIDMKEINRVALGGVAWMGKVALLCLGILAIFALMVVMSVQTAVMLTAIALPKTAVWHKRELKVRRDSTNTSEISAPRKKAMAS